MKKLGQGAITTGAGTLYRAPFVVNSLVLKIGFMSRFFVVKCSNIFIYIINLYSSPPFFASRNNSKKTTFVSFCGAASILKIYASSNISKIENSIIRMIPINVVNVKFRPLTIAVEPCKPMFPKSLPKKTNQSVPVFVESTASNVCSLISAPSIGKEESGIRVVPYNFFKLFYCKIGFAHAIRSFQAIVWEVMQGVCRLLALRNYNTGVV